MTERIYTRDQRGRLEPLEDERFEKEDELQALIAEHPELLDGTQMRPENPLRWILIAREQGIAESSDAAARWAVDLLLADQDALPTLVEVKRGSNPEIRRTVVGQMLEYAAHAARTWTADTLRRTFEESTDTRDLDPDKELEKLLAPDGEEEPGAEGFWERVATNLDASRLRLLFVADDIPVSLERVVEFLNAQMAGIEVLAVEIKQFKGDSRQTLVPRVIGRTAASPRSQQQARRPKLNRESFLNAFVNPEHRTVAARLLGVAVESGAIVEQYSNGLGIRIHSHWKKPVGVAWLFPPSEWGHAVLKGLTAVSLGTSMDLSAMEASLPDDKRLAYAALRQWMDEIAGYDFAKDASTPYYHARTISYDDALRHIDQLSGSLKRVVSEIRSS